MSSMRHGTLYTGFTSDLRGRVWQHKEGIYEGFTKDNGVTMLVWYEVHDQMDAGIQREKQIKDWKRAWKIELIEKVNPTWRDLYEELNG